MPPQQQQQQQPQLIPVANVALPANDGALPAADGAAAAAAGVVQSGEGLNLDGARQLIIAPLVGGGPGALHGVAVQRPVDASGINPSLIKLQQRKKNRAVHHAEDKLAGEPYAFATLTSPNQVWNAVDAVRVHGPIVPTLADGIQKLVVHCNWTLIPLHSDGG